MVMGGNVDFGDKNRSYIICHFLANTITFGLESKYSCAFLFKNKKMNPSKFAERRVRKLQT